MKTRSRAIWTRFEELYNEGDAEGVAPYAPDADRITTGGDIGHGRAEIQEQYAAGLATREADPTIRPLRADIIVRFLRPDVALLDGTAVWDSESSIQFTVIATGSNDQWSIAAGRRGLVSCCLYGFHPYSIHTASHPRGLDYPGSFSDEGLEGLVGHIIYVSPRNADLSRLSMSLLGPQSSWVKRKNGD